MDWLEGKSLGDWMQEEHTQKERNRVGQSIWDFYAFQLHQLKKSHADPHPGNFIITNDNQVGVIDFGCIKEIPEDFYQLYRRMMVENLSESQLIEIYEKLSMIHDQDSEEERVLFISLYDRMIRLLSLPFKSSTFHFGESDLFEQIHVIMNEVIRNRQIRNANAARGSKHSIFVNRIYFGLYSILTELQAEVRTDSYM